jgi:hypothetical protein
MQLHVSFIWFVVNEKSPAHLENVRLYSLGGIGDRDVVVIVTHYHRHQCRYQPPFPESS